MQLFEILFLVALALVSAYNWLQYRVLILIGLVLLLAGLVLEGWRWQMIPAYAAFILMLSGLLKKNPTRLVWRLFAAVPLIVLVGCSALLAQLMPIVSLPVPSGPHGVGTFDFSITDSSRVERFAPGRHRELFVEVWYPANMESLERFPVRTLFHDLYRGEFNRTSFIFDYVKRIETHSHVDAPVADDHQRFPVLLFNHARDFGFTAQNQVLMEHLASHGYVVFSIAHPYHTPKVNLSNAGTVFRAGGQPVDLDLPRREISNGIVGRTWDSTGDMRKVSALKELLYPLSAQYVALPEADRPAFLEQAAASPSFEPYRAQATKDLLQDFIDYEYLKDGSLTQYWVEDNQFIADSIANMRAPVEGFSRILDLERLGVFGMSYGGSVAAEFCKIDPRCKAGANLDGTQLGVHWDRRLPVPFLMLYHDGHQGGNDFAYLPPTADFREYRIRGSTHTDFTDFAYLWPILKPFGFAGSIDGWRMMDILNRLNLDFFEEHLKGRATAARNYADIPEIEGGGVE